MLPKMKYRGVYYDAKRDLYRAACEHGGKSIFIGRYITAKEAALAYDKKVIELWGPFANTNFGNDATTFQLLCYSLCSPDFAGYSQRVAAIVLGSHNSSVCVALKRLKKKHPNLFPIYGPRKKLTQQFEDWMSNEVVVKI